LKVQSCNKIIKHQAQALYTPQFENKTNGVLLIEVVNLDLKHLKKKCINGMMKLHVDQWNP